MTNTLPFEIPQPFENTWSSCASSRGVKLLLLCLFFINNKIFASSNYATEQEFKTKSAIASTIYFFDLHNNSCQCIAPIRKTQPTHLINIATFSTFATLQSQFQIHWTWNSIPNWLHLQQRQLSSHWSWQANIKEQYKCLPSCSAVCTPLDLAYNTFAVWWNLAKTYICRSNACWLLCSYLGYRLPTTTPI